MTTSSNRVLAVIPARGGSKTVPGKNVRMIAGLPLIAHTIFQSKQSRRLTRTVVSTDDARIHAVAIEYGADVPFLRPATLAMDHTPMVPVLQHALREVERAEDVRYHAVVVLQPTSPMRTSEDIDRTVECLLESGADSAVTVCRLGKLSHPWLVVGAADDGRVTPFVSRERYVEFAHRNRDELPPALRLTAAVYAVTRATLMDRGEILGDDVRAVLTDELRAIDIDTADEFLMAEALMRSWMPAR